MPLIIPNGFGVLTLRWLAESDPEEMVSTVGYSWTGADEGNPQIHAIALNSCWKTSFPASAFSSRYTYKGARVVYRLPGGGDLLEGEITESIVGTGTASPIPSNSALLVRKTSSLGGRRNKGRFYFPPWFLPESSIDSNGRMSSGDVAGLQTRFTSFFDCFIEGTDPVVIPVILHSSGSPTPTAVNAFVVQDQIATQRRRMRP